MPQTRERDEALTQLNAQLMDITTLYGQFADEFDLHECKLAILHCAGHYDSGLVESLWRSIVSEGEGKGGLVRGQHLQGRERVDGGEVGGMGCVEQHGRCVDCPTACSLYTCIAFVAVSNSGPAYQLSLGPPAWLL